MKLLTALTGVGVLYVGWQLLKPERPDWVDDLLLRTYAPDFHPMSDEMGPADVFEVAARIAGAAGIPVLWALALVHDRDVPLANLPAAMVGTITTMIDWGKPDLQTAADVVRYKDDVLDAVAVAHGGHARTGAPAVIMPGLLGPPAGLSGSPMPAHTWGG